MEVLDRGRRSLRKRIERIGRQAAVLEHQRISLTASVADCFFLAAVGVLSLVLYTRGLGFYSDDYSRLERMRVSSETSLFGLYHAVKPALGQRPVQALIFAALYRLFGLESFGYHVFNAIVFVTAILLLYLALRELRLSRLVVIAVPLVYSTLPHYSTDRFWLAAFQVNVSTACCALTLFAGLRALRSRSLARAWWLSLALVGIVGSVLAYEVVIPLFALVFGLIWYAARRLPQSQVGRLGRRALPAALLVALAVVVVVKTALVVGGGQNAYRLGFANGGFLHHMGYLASGTLKINVGTYLIALPYVVFWAGWHQFSVATALIAAGSGLLAFVYLWRLARNEPEIFPSGREWRAVTAIGLIAFVLGYAIFLTNDVVLFRSAGLDNRVNAAAALGVAGVLVGVLGWLTNRWLAERRASAVAIGIALLVAAGVFLVDTTASYWTAASKRQHRIIAGLSAALGPEPRRARILLDGVCPELGPAVVFAEQGDLTAALSLHYRNERITADVVGNDPRAKRLEIESTITFIDRTSSKAYPYGRDLFVYNVETARLYHLVDRRDALHYLALRRPFGPCAAQRSFAWGFPISRWFPFV